MPLAVDHGSRNLRAIYFGITGGQAYASVEWRSRLAPIVRQLRRRADRRCADPVRIRAEPVLVREGGN
jgi:hypothetical protein